MPSIWKIKWTTDWTGGSEWKFSFQTIHPYPKIDRFLIAIQWSNCVVVAVAVVYAIQLRMMAIWVFEAYIQCGSVVLMKSKISNIWNNAKNWLTTQRWLLFIRWYALLWLAALIKALIHITCTQTQTHARHSMANFHFDIVTAVYIYLDTWSLVLIIGKQSNNNIHGDFAS